MHDVAVSAASGETILQVISDLAAWREIAHDWQLLAADLPGITPFQTPEWLFAWWDHFGSGDVQIFAFRNRGRLVAFIPCFKHLWDGRRQLTLVGSGITDFLEPLITPPYREPVLTCLRTYLRTNQDWDICEWQDLASDTPLVELENDEQLVLNIRPDVPCSEIAVRGSFETYWNGRPSGLKRNVRRSCEKAIRRAEPQISVVRNFQTDHLDALVRLHSARWREQGEPGTIAANRSAKFLSEIAAVFARKDMLLSFSLRFEGEIAAVIMAFDYRNSLFGYLSAFDPAYSELGFGRALLYEAIHYAFQHRYLSWNFLRGSEPYKSDWGARSIPKLRVTIRRR